MNHLFVLIKRTCLAGFSLLECLLAMVVVSILALLGVAGLRSSQNKHVMATLKSNLLTDVLQIEQIARDTQHSIVVCGSKDGGHCQQNWAAGLRAIDAATGRLILFHPYGAAGVLHWSGSLARQIVFDVTGRPSGVQGSWCYQLGRLAQFKLTLLRTGALHW